MKYVTDGSHCVHLQTLLLAFPKRKRRNTFNIVSFDGGGMRGMLCARWLTRSHSDKRSQFSNERKRIWYETALFTYSLILFTWSLYWCTGQVTATISYNARYIFALSNARAFLFDRCDLCDRDGAPNEGVSRSDWLHRHGRRLLKRRHARYTCAFTLFSHFDWQGVFPEYTIMLFFLFSALFFVCIRSLAWREVLFLYLTLLSSFCFFRCS